jgi:hypothetical protein
MNRPALARFAAFVTLALGAAEFAFGQAADPLADAFRHSPASDKPRTF